ncbi:MAG: hypothetical protein U0168_01900 [Nannocystaceae bacterium]|jgi:hypothetical protein
MPSPLHDAVLELAESAGTAGIAMGTAVDMLAARGFPVEQAERAIWELLERRRLTPAGFVCRVIRRRNPDGSITPSRVYEFMLVPWSAALDAQLDLAWGSSGEGGR